jgi:serine/threonine-protein kinase HipA
MFDTVEIKQVKRELGLLVKTLRKQRGLSQIQLAKSLNVSRTTIQNLELGKNFTVDTIFNIFGHEIGRLGLDENEKRSSFQFNPVFLKSNLYKNIFPKTGIIKRINQVQLFNQFDNNTFKGIPPQFADSLPDRFGSIIFKAWLDNKSQKKITVLERLAYVGNRGMGAIEYKPSIKLDEHTTIDLNEIIDVLKEVLDLKKTTKEKNLNNQALINIFKIGTSAGGARPKILISEEKKTGKIIPGDLEYSNDYKHYLVKLAIDEEIKYPREIVEFCYYQIIQKVGIRMMESKLINDKHFATLRFDRQNGEKKHILTASGITGWDYKNSNNSSYENLFKLTSFLKVPHTQIEELFRRMVFNVIYGNVDDHLKNHSFIYNKNEDNWEMSPAYDITFALNPLMSFKNPKRALSINGKRSNIQINDILKLADEYTIKNPEGIINEIQSYSAELIDLFSKYDIPKFVSEKINENFIKLLR